MGKLKEFLKGGKGDGASLDEFDPEEVKMGMEVEMEHTNDPKIAREICYDHLKDDSAYYSKLKKAGLADELEGEKEMKIEEAAKNTKVEEPIIQKSWSNKAGFNDTEVDIFKALADGCKIEGWVRVGVPLINHYRAEWEYALLSDSTKRVCVYAVTCWSSDYDYSLSINACSFDTILMQNSIVSGTTINLTKDEVTDPGKICGEITKFVSNVPAWLTFSDFVTLNTMNDTKEEK